MTILLRHSKVDLALHELRAGTDDGRPLLLLHGLGERSAATPPGETGAWPGPVVALDFTGHGDSTVPAGGGYTAEQLMADADIALAHLGPSTIVGRGLGAYVALLVAGARPALVRGAVLADGPGLAGGGPSPGSSTVLQPLSAGPPVPDPYALVELATDIRPPDYAASFARLAIQQSGLDEPVTVAARARPEWLRAVADEPGVVEDTVEAALSAYGLVR